MLNDVALWRTSWMLLDVVVAYGELASWTLLDVE